MTTPKQSPTPWRQIGTVIGSDKHAALAMVAWRTDPTYEVAMPATQEEALANAAFIVRAVNSHERLVAENLELRNALERIATYPTTYGSGNDPLRALEAVRDIARTSLAQEGGAKL